MTAYTPERTRNAEAFIKSCAMDAMKGAPPIAGPCKLSILAVFQIPASWSRTRRGNALSGWTHATKRPDADNLMKMTDALNGIVWLDDSQVVDARVLKAYGEPPRMEIQVVPL